MVRVNRGFVQLGRLGELHRHGHRVSKAVKVHGFRLFILHWVCVVVMMMMMMVEVVVGICVGMLGMRRLSVHVDRLKSNHDDRHDDVTALFWTASGSRRSTRVLTICVVDRPCDVCRHTWAGVWVGSRSCFRHVGRRNRRLRRPLKWRSNPTKYTWGLLLSTRSHPSILMILVL